MTGVKGLMTIRLIFLSLALLLPQEKPAADPEFQKKVDAAVEKGVTWLLERYAKRGIAEVRLCELVCLTLVHGGVRLDHPLLVQEINKALSRPVSQTYNAGLLALLLEKLDRKQYQTALAEVAIFFVDSQCRNGQWNYSGRGRRLRAGYAPPPPNRKDDPQDPGATRSDSNEPVKPIKIPPAAAPTGVKSGDNSNAQYAIFSLFAAARAKCELPKEMLEKAAAWWTSSQNADGGWGYGGPAEDVPSESTGSMTTAGLAGLFVCRTYLGQDPMADPAVKKGLEWLGKNLAFSRNPGADPPEENLFYYLYGLERVGRISGLTEFGGKDWYKEGATWLIANQKPNGQWGGGDKNDPDPINTCFAILFLRRATPELPKFKDVATGDTKKRD